MKKGVWCLGWLVLSGCIAQPVYHTVKNDNPNKKFFQVDPDTTARKAALDVPMEGISTERRDAMLQEINAWKGTPYRFGAVEKGKGTDCSGFAGYIFKKILNVQLPRETRAIYTTGESVAQSDLRFGDLVFFQNTYKGSQGASHVGIYVGENKMAHASTTVGVTISDLSEAYYARHFLGCRRIVK